MILMWKNFEKLWAKWGAILEKSQTGIMRVGLEVIGISSGNSISKFQGFIKKGVELPGIKKNSCGICFHECLVFGLGPWNFQATV